MLSLVLRGKLPITEDVLTACFFDALHLEMDVSLLRSLLAACHAMPGFEAPLGFERFEVELWPRIATGEPDVRIRLFKDEVEVASMLVEAKLGAQKSGSLELLDDGSPGDQLARYLLEESKSNSQTFIVYLTHHAAFPELDLNESRAQLHAFGRDDLAARVLWLPWRAVEAAISGPAYVRVREVLRRARMFWFDGIRLESSLRSFGAASFYRSNAITYRWSPLPVRFKAQPSFYGEHSNQYRWPRRTTHRLVRPGFYGGKE